MATKKRQRTPKGSTLKVARVWQRRGLAPLLAGILIILALAGLTVLITSLQSPKQPAQPTFNTLTASPGSPAPVAGTTQAAQLPLAPDITLPTLSKESFLLSAHRGGVVLLYFSFPG